MTRTTTTSSRRQSQLQQQQQGLRHRRQSRRYSWGDWTGQSRSHDSNNPQHHQDAAQQQQEQQHSHKRANSVIAATAGANTWKTWAGRSHGGDDFEWSDLYRGVGRELSSRLLPRGRAPKECPVCFTEPDEWHKTSSCGHWVCMDCLQHYASSQVHDLENIGPLKCPICPMPLRESDAVIALADQEDLIHAWDVKIRNQVLRALPNFRPCPHCNNDKNEKESDKNKNYDNNNDNGRSMLLGGGFITADCVDPELDIRREAAEKWVHCGIPTIIILGFVLYITYIHNYFTESMSTHLCLDIINSILPVSFFYKLVKIALGYMIAPMARDTLQKPLNVECPCCNQSFLLKAEDTNTVNTDEATKEWLGQNTRPCPSCNVPISKLSGCNHMKCTHCQVPFCWACMKPKTQCKAFACDNGAPFGNAAPVSVNDFTNNGGRPRPVVTILDRIIQLEGIGRSGLTFTTTDIYILCAIFVARLGRNLFIVQSMATLIVGPFLAVVSGIAMLGMSGGGLLILVFYLLLFGGRQQQGQQQQQNRRGRVRQQRHRLPDNLRGWHWNLTFPQTQQHHNQHEILQDALLNEAIRRSMQEQ